MAEEKPQPTNTSMSMDDVSALEYVLHHVRGASPSSMTRLQLDELVEDQG
ncbi:MAG: hypothetical protein Q4B05_03520 [Candidatus Saccharibacteria bacterium]|nr:hypothetical protein [Candidatus Saccharibacteria bacterium]